MDERNDLISVIIPVYNVNDYLERCVKSIVKQTYINLEIILVDDGSTDESGKLCDEYRKIDERIKVIHQTNAGLASARNSGLDVAKGKYIGFVDSDDYVEFDMYEKMYNAIKDYNAPIACCGMVDYFEKETGRKPQRRYTVKKVTYYNRKMALKSLCLYDGMDFSVCTKLIRADLFIGLRFPVGKVSEDVPVVYELYNRVNGIVHVGKAKYFYCHRQDSISGKPFCIRRLDYLFFIQEIYKDILCRYPSIRKEAEVLYFNAIVYIWINVREQESEKKQYKVVERRLRRMIKYYLLRFFLNPYIKKEQRKYIVREILFN